MPKFDPKTSSKSPENLEHRGGYQTRRKRTFAHLLGIRVSWHVIWKPLKVRGFEGDFQLKPGTPTFKIIGMRGGGTAPFLQLLWNFKIFEKNDKIEKLKCFECLEDVVVRVSPFCWCFWLFSAKFQVFDFNWLKIVKSSKSKLIFEIYGPNSETNSEKSEKYQHFIWTRKTDLIMCQKPLFSQIFDQFW